MKKNEIYTGTVRRLQFPNKGYVAVEGEEKEVLVKNVLPEQKISFRCSKAKKTKAEGRLLEVLEKSPWETQTPPCPHFWKCGGCSYQTLSYEGQKELKRKQVKKLLCDVYPEFPQGECVSSPAEWEYRNKMEFSFGDEEKNGPLTLGLHKRDSFYDIVPVTDCQIVHPDIRRVLKETLEFYKEKNIPFYHKMTREGVLRHLLVRRAKGTEELLLCLVTTSQQNAHEKEWCDRVLKLPVQGKFAGILHMVNDGLSDTVAADKTTVLYGNDYFYEEILGLRFQITPFSFFQTNSYGAETLYSKAREYLGEVEGNVIFDLYCGTGTIAQVLAPVAKKVIGVEIVEEAVVAARENARCNGLTNCEFYAGDVKDVMETLPQMPDTIVLDPPREGIHPKAMKKILSYGVEKILYISCKPTSLARDLEQMLAYGYVPVRAECVDMFPWTRGIETVVLLEQHPEKEKKATTIIEHITYDVLDEQYGTDIFTDPTIKGELGVNAMKDIYFVVETKGSMNSM